MIKCIDRENTCLVWSSSPKINQDGSNSLLLVTCYGASNPVLVRMPKSSSMFPYKIGLGVLDVVMRQPGRIGTNHATQCDPPNMLSIRRASRFKPFQPTRRDGVPPWGGELTSTIGQKCYAFSCEPTPSAYTDPVALATTLDRRAGNVAGTTTATVMPHPLTKVIPVKHREGLLHDVALASDASSASSIGGALASMKALMAG